MGNIGFNHKFTAALNTIPLSSAQKIVITNRYIDIVTTTEGRYWWTAFVYWVLTLLTLIAAALIAALSAYNTDNAAIKWTVFALGLAIVISSGIMSAFEIAKKRVLDFVVLEKLKSEGWTFVAGVGKYTCDDMAVNYKLFCERVEKIQGIAVSNSPDAKSADNTANEILAAGRDQGGMSAYVQEDHTNTVITMTGSNRGRKINEEKTISSNHDDNILSM